MISCKPGSDAFRVLQYVASDTSWREVTIPAWGGIPAWTIPAGSEPNDGAVTAADVVAHLGSKALAGMCHRLIEAGYLESGTYRVTSRTLDKWRAPDWMPPATWTDTSCAIVRALVKTGPMDRARLSDAVAHVRDQDEDDNESGDPSGAFKRALSDLIDWGEVATARALWLTQKGRKALEAK
jgi:hypothetical protein